MTESQWASVTSGVKKRRLQEDLSVAVLYLKGAYKKHVNKLFSRTSYDKTSGNGLKVRKG